MRWKRRSRFLYRKETSVVFCKKNVNLGLTLLGWRDIITELIRKRIELEISDEKILQLVKKCLTFINEFGKMLKLVAEIETKRRKIKRRKKLLTNN